MGVAANMAAQRTGGQVRTTPRNIRQFGQAAYHDIEGLVKGILDLPELAVSLVTDPIDTTKSVVSGIGKSYQELLTDPVGKFLRNPVSTALDVLPVGGVAVRAGLAPKVLGRARVLSLEEAAEAAKLGKVGRIKRLFSEKTITKLERDASEIVDMRYGNIGKARWDARQYRRSLQKQFNADTLEDITFYIQRTRNPKFDAKGATVEAVEQRLRDVPGAVEAADKISQRLEQFRKAANETGLAEDIKFREHYITQFWRPKKGLGWKRGGAQAAVSRFATHNAFADPRSFRNFLQGMHAGYEPVTLNAAELLSMYESKLATIIENNRMVRALHGLEVEPGKFALMRSSKAPPGYVTVDYPALRKPFFGVKTLEGVADDLKLPFIKYAGRGEKILGATDIPSALKGGGRKQAAVKEITQAMAPVKAHPDIVPMLRSVFEEPFTGNIVRKLSTINAWMKTSALSFSFFHHFALTESAFASLGLKGISLGKKSGFRRGLELLKDEAFSKQAIEAGLNLGPLSDVQIGIVNRHLQGIEAGLRGRPLLGGAVKVARKAKDLFDTVLWDYYHTGLKSYAFHSLYERALRKLPDAADAKVVAKDVAAFVNDAFGGQNWDMMMKSARWRQMAHFTLLAPDWTISNLRIALRPFDSNKVIKQFGREYWFRSALAATSMASMLNYAMSKAAEGEGRWIWDNEPGHKLDIQLPWRDDRGRRQYVKLGKQFREPMRWVTEPTKILGAKLAPSIQIAIEQLTGTSTTGFPQEFKDVPVYEGAGERLASVAEKFVPFAVRGTNVGFSFPKSAGTTGFKVIQGLKRALREKDREAMVEWMRAAANNNYNPSMLLRLARREIAQEQRREFRRKAGQK